MKEHFLIAIGGTGMRCAEAFVHLCAMGMFDNTTIHILLLDADAQNGNLQKLRTVISNYRISRGDPELHNYEGTPNGNPPTSETLFSAKIIPYICTLSIEPLPKGMERGDKDNKHLADLIFTSNEQDFDLKEGFRALTHLGSVLMFNALNNISTGKTTSDNTAGFLPFVRKIQDAPQNSRIFTFGSVFGGTGASSIPVLPNAIERAISHTTRQNNYKIENCFFGSVLLTSYFSFPTPKADQRAKERIIAEAHLFKLNSQAALMYYQQDPTIKQKYQHLYVLGTPNNKFEVSSFSDDGTFITGGSKQINKPHYIELMAAAAAIDFFNTEDSVLSGIKSNLGGPKYYYKVIDNDKLEFDDFIPNNSSNFERFFRSKLSLFLGTALLNLKYQLYRDINGPQILNYPQTPNFPFEKVSASFKETISWLGSIQQSQPLRNFLRLRNIHIEDLYLHSFYTDPNYPNFDLKGGILSKGNDYDTYIVHLREHVAQFRASNQLKVNSIADIHRIIFSSLKTLYKNL